MRVRVRTGGPGDAAAMLGLFDGAVRWLAANGREGQWGTVPFSLRPDMVLRVDCWAGGDGALVGYYVRAGFTPTLLLSVGGWPAQLFEQRLDRDGGGDP